MSFSPSGVGALLKKGLLKEGSRVPQHPLSYAPGIMFINSPLNISLPTFKLTVFIYLSLLNDFHSTARHLSHMNSVKVTPNHYTAILHQRLHLILD